MPCASLRLRAPTCPDAPELFEQPVPVPVPMPAPVPVPMPIPVHMLLPRDANLATPAPSLPAQWFVCVCFALAFESCWVKGAQWNATTATSDRPRPFS